MKYLLYLARIILYVALVIVAISVLLLIGPKEGVDEMKARFDAATISSDVEAYIAKSESSVANTTPIIPGAEKKIVWAGEQKGKTAISLVYLHGFTATREESRPVADIVARALHANIFFSRLSGHGLKDSYNALGAVNAGKWIRDAKEAVAIGKKIGDRVILLTMSTGGTLAKILASDQALAGDIVGIVFMSPNFKVKDSAIRIFNLAFARYWANIVPDQKAEAVNLRHAQYWTLTYKSRALVPLQALIRYAGAIDSSSIEVPALFIFSDDDTTISAAAVHKEFANWGGKKERHIIPIAPEDGKSFHVIAGDIRSPRNTKPVAQMITRWIQGIQPQ